MSGLSIQKSTGETISLSLPTDVRNLEDLVGTVCKRLNKKKEYPLQILWKAA